MRTIFKCALVLLAVSFMGCQSEPLEQVAELSLTERAKAWFETSHDSRLNENFSYSGTPDWERVALQEGTVYAPLITNDADRTKGTIFTKPYLVYSEKEDGSFVEQLKVMFIPDLTSSKDNALNSSYFIHYDSSNSLTEFLLPQDKVSREPMESNTTSKGEGCTTIGVFLITTYTDGTVEKILLYTYEECPEIIDAGDSLSGGDGSSSDTEDYILVPSCRSFEYANFLLVKGCGVSNIRNIFVAAGLNPDGTTYYHEVWLNITASYFSMNPALSNGYAANLSALALEAADIETKGWFMNNPRATGTALKYEWEQNIRSAMRNIGGDWSKTAYFPIKGSALAPYVEDFTWDRADCKI